ncbi:MAG: hypothetical protein J5965_06265, partial [Aeriscardovia sp.]|nr:hypothetical protein [Aeriscardovia sp.]
LDTALMEEALEKAYADPTNDGLKEAVAAYREDVSDLAAANEQKTTAIADYVKASDQLQALTAQKTVNDAKATVSALHSALETVMATKIDDATNTELGYSDIAKMNTAGTIATKTDHADAATSETLRADMKAAFSNALDVAEKTGFDDGKAVTGVSAIAALFKGNSSGSSAALMTAQDVTPYGNALEALEDAKRALGGNVTSQSKLSDGTTVKKLSDALKSAQEEVVSKFSGPQLMTGANVGVNAAGQIVSTASGENAITITANKAGIGGQISGFNIRIADAQGNLKKSAEASLDAFSETVRAQNKSEDNAISLQVGAQANQAITIGLTDMRSEALGLRGADGTKLNISTRDKANAAINVLDNAISKALDQQTTIGSIESRLTYTSSNLTTSSENVQASESTIRDADMAKEMTEYTKNNVLLQAAQSMLAQANQSSSSVLSLLQ